MPGKRGNREGSIRKRADGRWEARILFPNGERASFYGKTRQDAAQRLARAVHDFEKGIVPVHENQTVSTYLTSWIEGYKQRRRRTSYERNERTVRLHLIPGLGKISLTALTPQHIETFYTRKLAEGTTAFTVRMCHKVLRQALNDALRLGLVYRNVVPVVRPPRSRTREMAFYNEDQARTLLDAVKGNRLEALLVLALATGMRIGELLALTWDDVELDNGSLIVRANLVVTTVGKFREEGKTSASRRRIALPSIAVEALRHHRAHQAKERLQLGHAWQDLNLVFPNTIGGYYDVYNWRAGWFYPLLKRAGLPRIRPHDLRHTAATLLLARGVPVKVVSEMLGHANVGITLSTYGHVLPHMQQLAASVMDDMLRGRGADAGLGRQLGSKMTLVANSRRSRQQEEDWR
jgi:integrase